MFLKPYLKLPSSSLYKKCKSLYKTQYSANERLVFAFTGEIPFDLLAHLQRVISHLDISNCFVCIVNNHPGTPELITRVHHKYSADKNNIFEHIDLDLPENFSIDEFKDHNPLLNPPESMCMYPWTQLEFKWNGTVRPCCVYSDPIKDELGTTIDLNVNKDISFRDIYHSTDMKRLRQQFRTGGYPPGCSKCWQEESIGKRSDRQLYQWIASDKMYDLDYESESIDNLTSFDLKLGTLCNLSCRICNEKLSSSWAVETLRSVPANEKKDHFAYHALRNGEWPKKNQQFWTELESLLPNVTYLEFAGGEPLMHPHQWQVLKLACDLGYADQITLRYNSNGTILPSTEQMDIWKQFKLVRLDLSIDDIGSRFDYQRNGSTWHTVQTVVGSLHQDKPANIQTQVTVTVNIQNVYYMPELVSWIDQQGFDSLWLNQCHSPPEFHLSSMTAQFKQQVLNKWQNTDFGRHSEQFNVFYKYISDIVTVGPEKFIKFTRNIDTIRNQNFADAHSETALALGYTK